MIAVAPHHRFVQPMLASYISFGVGCYCFIHAEAMREAREKGKTNIVPIPYFLSAFFWELRGLNIAKRHKFFKYLFSSDNIFSSTYCCNNNSKR